MPAFGKLLIAIETPIGLSTPNAIAASTVRIIGVIFGAEDSPAR